MTYELADFDPTSGHLHTCIRFRFGTAVLCGNGCADHLYAIAQDAEQAIAQVRAVCEEWDALSKGETGTTARIREALETRP